MVSEVGEVICNVYAVGAQLVILDGGLGIGGEIPDELRGKVRALRPELLEALDGDPLHGPGWEARTALHRQALQWLSEEIEERKPGGALRATAARKVLCREDVTNRLDTAWCDGGFDEFRAALREYAKAGLRAARGE